MLEKVKEVLKIFEAKGFVAYIVGGYVRDYLLGVDSLDIDICTNAIPKDIVMLFDLIALPDKEYGSVILNYKGIKIDVTTWRKEIKYEGNRRPIKIKYINDLKKDLLRRDFTINTLCMNSDGVIMDVLNVKDDLDKKIIKTVGNPRYRIKEDALRILRAIRFATTLDFDIDDKTKKYIMKYGYLLKKLSYSRKKSELDKIFVSPNKEKGIKLILELKISKYLEIDNLNNIKLCDNVLGIWSQLILSPMYPFTNLEKTQMNKIRQLMKLDILDKYNIYKYGLYLSTIVADINNYDKKKLNIMRNELVIKNINEIMIKPMEISTILNRKPGSYLKDIMLDIEKSIIYEYVKNDYNSIKEYIVKKYL